MSEIVVRMEMPKIPQNCGECKFHKPLYYTQYCVLEGRNCAPWKTRKDWCPIVGVLPEQHGDLIDKETAKNAFDSSFLTFRMKDGETMRGFYQRTIDELPALIAEERKDNGTTAD